jgi:FkbM family methyltransferase
MWRISAAAIALVVVLVVLLLVCWQRSSRTSWWRRRGRHLRDPRQRLQELHQHLGFKHGQITDEYPEQLMIMSYLTAGDTVLEIGGNIGRASCVIAQILDDDRRLVSLESNPLSAQQLAENRDLNGFHFQIEPAALSRRPLIQTGWDTVASDIVLPGYFKVKTIDWTTLKKKYDLSFDVLVADCEGALYYILQDEPALLSGFKRVIMENDYHELAHKQAVDSNLKRNGFQRIYVQPGGWGPCADYFFEVWQNSVNK